MSKAIWMKTVLALMFGHLLLVANASAQDDVLNLESTFKGNQEQPRVLYIVPWQQPGADPVAERPIIGELDSLFQPIDRDSFQRELHYLDYLESDEHKTDNLKLFD